MKNKIALLLLITLLQLRLVAQNVGINATGAIPDPSAMLDVSATNKGMLTPRMTQVERNLIASPANGLLIYQTDNSAGFYFYNGIGWIPLSSGGASNYWSLNGNNIFNNNAGNVGIGTDNPLEKLAVVTGNDSYGMVHRNTDGSNIIGTFIGGTSAGFGTYTNTNMRIFCNNLSAMFISAANGNVGINTNNPLDKLSVFTNGYGVTQTNGVATIGTWIGNFQGQSTAKIGTKTNHSLNFFTNDGPAQMTLLPNGGFGIGTTEPSGKVQITHPGPSAHLILEHPSIGQYSRFLFTNTGASRYWGIAGESGTGIVGNDRLSFYNTGTGFESMVMAGNGYVSIPGQLGIGTFNPEFKFAVKGNVRCNEVVVETGWADYVFDQGYKLASLADVKKFIDEHKHLPNMPAAAEIEKKGLHLGDIQRRMMEKIEELTLYMIEQDKTINDLKQQLKELKEK